MERIDLMQYYNNIPKKRKYRVNKLRFVLFFFLSLLIVLLFIVIAKYYTSFTTTKYEATFDFVTEEEVANAKDILETDFEATAPQELTLHIPESEIIKIEAQEKEAEITGSYIVKRGDSLWSIANKYNISVLKLARMNGISPSKILKVGQVLNINPDMIIEKNSTTEKKLESNKNDYSDYIYNVKKGDSLWSIAIKYGVYVSTLQYMNELSSSGLRIGQKLNVTDINERPFKVLENTDYNELSKYFNTEIQEFIALNDVKNPSEKIKKGTLVRVPNNNPYFVSNTKVKKFGTSMAKWPVTGNIASPYGWRKHPVYGKKIFHNGIDIENKKGTPVQAVTDGKVIFAAYKGNSGRLVIIQHSNGYQTIYAHLDNIKIKKGNYVKKGDIIGTVGNTGVSTGPHLHFGLRKNGKFENPMNILN
jgi:murein DD-endopeptidase MepM/ murein hydrolase activator NlpD